jgi:branched-chain amino acid transport system ATP-binding protein
MPHEVMLEVEGVSKSFGALAALSGVSLMVRVGEVFSVIGPNGAGKSTLFNVISGLHTPTAGRIVFRGKEVTGLAPEVINRQGLAKTFQITNIFPGISVYDNVRVAAQSRMRVSGRLPSLWRLPDVEGPVMELLGAFGLAARRDDLAQNLSHGEQRYLEICLALATDPALLLLDEPTAGMTPGETKEATALIRRIALARRLTVLLIEHDMSVVMGISDRIAVLHFGEKIAEGPPEAIRSDPKVLDAYLGGADESRAWAHEGNRTRPLICSALASGLRPSARTAALSPSWGEGCFERVF